MKLYERDQKALEDARRVIQNCARYHTMPAGWFPLLIRMYTELQAAGMIEFEESEALD